MYDALLLSFLLSRTAWEVVYLDYLDAVNRTVREKIHLNLCQSGLVRKHCQMRDST